MVAIIAEKLNSVVSYQQPLIRARKPKGPRNKEHKKTVRLKR